MNNTTTATPDTTEAKKKAARLRRRERTNLQDLEDQFLKKLYEAGFLEDDEVNVEKFIMKLDSLVCHMPKARKKDSAGNEIIAA